MPSRGQSTHPVAAPTTVKGKKRPRSTPEEARAIILEGILSRRRISFVYSGIKRVVDPHLLARNEFGNDVLVAWCHLGYRATGFFSSGTPWKRGWRIFNLHKIRTPTLWRRGFRRRTGGLDSKLIELTKVYHAAFPLRLEDKLLLSTLENDERSRAKRKRIAWENFFGI